MKISAQVVWRDIDGCVFVIDSLNEKIHELNETASFVFINIDKGFDKDEIVDRIILEYDIDRETARQDISNLISDFKKKGIIDEK